MAQSTRDILDITKSEDIDARTVSSDTSLDLEGLGKRRLSSRDDGMPASPKTPLNSPRNSMAMAESPRLKRSPRHADIASLVGQASPPRDEGIADIEKRIRKNSDPNDLVLTRGKSNSNFSGIFKVTRRDSTEQVNVLKKSDETKTADETIIHSPRT